MTTIEHSYELIADHGAGDGRSVLERRSDGVIVLTTNAETREPVTGSQFVGQAWDSLDTSEWIKSLTIQFGSREAAELFVQAAGRELVTEAAK
jgi:hypothetical protein